MAFAQRMMGKGRSLIFPIDSKTENPFRDEVKLMSQQHRQIVYLRISYCIL